MSRTPVAAMTDRRRLRDALATARADLLAERTAAGNWIGELSTSALSTATATSALAIIEPQWRAAEPELSARLRTLIDRGVQWLAAHGNADGGWGDTDRSYSNIATTMLVRAAFELAGAAPQQRALIERAEQYIERSGGVAGIRRRYGADKTFAVPILTNAALAGLVDWREVSALPFEAACLPQSLFRFLGLPVVSYAVPALVAIGQAKYFRDPPAAPWRWVRRGAVRGSLSLLEKMQPASGGYLEAAPLTSFVAMSLAATGRAEHPVVRRAVDFLIASVRPDGSWPIDTNLATWNTTLALQALAAAGDDPAELAPLDWLLSCQHRARHPFTGAEPGGWGWTDLSGAVPDADDTPGALLSLAAVLRSPRLDPAQRERIREAARLGVRWLLRLQNSDGGWPTFCRGWSRQPFDRSGADLTAHALRALAAWREERVVLKTVIKRATLRGCEHLARSQHVDGGWIPLWFGNQDDPREENPVYGTAKVLLAYRDLDRLGDNSARRGMAWLVARQNADGGWGGGPALAERWRAGGAGGEIVSSVEETALAVEALAASDDADARRAVVRGSDWLCGAVEAGRHRESSPIGFYFAKLWYYEKLYPLTFTVAALGQAAQRLSPPAEASAP